MANYRLSEVAKDDLIRIYRYRVLKFETAQTEPYYLLFFEHFDKIAQNPFAFESVDYIKPGYRCCVCGSDRVYYKISDTTVAIMAILGKQYFKHLS